MACRIPSVRALLLGTSILTSLAGGVGAPAYAQTAQSGTATLDAVVISADRGTGTAYDSPAVVSVKTDKEIDRQNINSPRDLVRDEPGISVGNQPARTGSTNFVIRGIGENRVRLEIDGFKVPDFPGSNFGAGTYTRDFIDYDSLKRVEIIRGPASALYGSDAIGGVVSFITKDPSDYLALVGKDWFVSNKTGFDSANTSLYDTITAAGRVGAWESMVLYTHRYGHETRINSVRDPNPQTFNADNVLTKVVHTNEWGQFKLTGEFLNKKVGIDLNSEEISSFGTRVFSSTGEDKTQRERVSLDWNAPVKAWFADEVLTKIYWTHLFRQELSNQLRGPSAAPAPTDLRLTDADFLQTIYGAEIRATAARSFLDWNHVLVYGVTADSTTTARPRDRSQISLATGAVTKSVAGETFPNKNFPDTRTTQAAFYAQDTAQYGRLRIIPAIRFDYYHLTPNEDADFLRSNLTGVQVAELTANAVSPKLGATFDLSDNYRVFAQYSHGFRAPPYDNANFGFRNLAQQYEIVPNGNLKPETIDGFEGGLRARFDNGSSFQISAFYNKFKDFIETVNLPGPFPPGLTQRFQYQNLPQVTIYGFEGKAEWWFHSNWALFGHFAYAHGTDDDTGAAIDSVDPFSAVGGVRYRNANWTGEVRTRYMAEKNRVSAPTVFVVPESAVVDALLSYEMLPRFTVNAGVFNIFDDSYFNPQDVRGLLASNTNLELLRAPGRTFAVNAIFRW
jgi:hemoglobin/transferrin/lactoferrin receptor protein